jgi:uncharacterized membrane protein
MRLDRYLPEQRRLRADSRKQKLFVVGIVLGIHLFVVAGWTAWSTIRERNEPPREVIRFFDIAVFPAPPVVAPAAKGEEAGTAPAAPEQPPAATPTPPAPERQ